MSLALGTLCWIGLGFAGTRAVHAFGGSRKRGAVSLLVGTLLGLLVLELFWFALNRYVGVELSLLRLALTATGLGAASLALGIAAPSDTSRHWQRGEVMAAAGCIAIVGGVQGAGLFEPLADWDYFYYHSAFARLIAAGNFPWDIQRSYLLGYTAGFPQLPYFTHGLNTMLGGAAGEIPLAKLSALALHLGLGLLTYRIARDQAALPRGLALASGTFLAVLLNRAPATQDFTAIYCCAALWLGPNLFARPASAEPDAGAEPPLGRSQLLLACALLGGAGAASYVGLPVIALIGGTWAWMERDRAASDRATLAWAALVLAGPAALHSLRTFIAVGNPVYPAGIEWLGGPDITDWYLAHRPALGTRLALGSIPLVLASTGSIGTSYFLGSLTPLMHPASVPARWRTALVLWGFALFWGVVLLRDATPVYRYLFPLLPLAVVALAVGLRHACRSFGGAAAAATLAALIALGHSFRIELAGTPLGSALWIAAALTASFACRAARGRSTSHSTPLATLALLVLGIALARGGVLERSALGLLWAAPLMAVLWYRPEAWAGPLRRTAVVCLLFGLGLAPYFEAAAIPSTSLNNAATFRQMNDVLPDTACVLLEDARLFYLDRAVIGPDHRAVEAAMRSGTAAERVTALHTAGVSHLYTWREPRWAPLGELVEQLLGADPPLAREIGRSKTGRLYRLASSTRLAQSTASACTRIPHPSP